MVCLRRDLPDGCATGQALASESVRRTTNSTERGQRPQVIPLGAATGREGRLGGSAGRPGPSNARMRYPLRSTNRAATSSPRLATPTLAKMWRRCSCAVYGEISSLWAIRWVACPLRMSSATCCSRGVNP